MEGTVLTREKRDLGIRLPPGGVDWNEVEKGLLLQALEMTGGNQARAARLLSLSRDAFRYRLHKFGLLSVRPEEEVVSQVP